MKEQLDALNGQELLASYSKIMDLLKERKMIRTYNNPVSDYASWLVAKNLNLKLTINSKIGYDAVDEITNLRYQIKCRRQNSRTGNYQLGVIKNIDKGFFDYLIAVFLDKKFILQSAYQFPVNLIKKYSNFSTHQNGYILTVNSGILSDKETRNISHKFTIFH